MMELSDKQIAEYYHRSYQTVDGLWFMKIEEQYGFDAALDIDCEVWKVMPKIQARKLKSMGKMETGLDALMECFTTKLLLDGFSFITDKTSDGKSFRVICNKCPWHNIMVKARRENLSEKVGSRICNAEAKVWATEFGDGIHFELESQICRGCEFCIMKFSY
ncbi:DUF6125 family protein [Chloroflexota bacterium]